VESFIVTLDEKAAARAHEMGRASWTVLAWFLLTLNPLYVQAGGELQVPGPADAKTSSLRWPGDAQSRLAALALLQTLNADLLSHDSATATLEHWCASHHLASPARIVAERSAGPERAPSAEQRRELAVDENEPVRHRHVRLKCGEHVLSEADNWYVPSRLTPEMNQQLQATDTPFGQVVKPLRFLRHTLESRVLWSPLPADWESAGIPADRGPISVPLELLQHRALLLLPSGVPFSEVLETYTSEILVRPAVVAK
jgi:chorismate-pyruvate lyase